MSEWVSLGRGLARWGRCQLDVSRSQVNDAGLKASIARCSSLTSLNLTGLAEVRDDPIAGANPNPNPNPHLSPFTLTLTLTRRAPCPLTSTASTLRSTSAPPPEKLR